jgi:hypothetical protein
MKKVIFSKAKDREMSDLLKSSFANFFNVWLYRSRCASVLDLRQNIVLKYMIIWLHRGMQLRKKGAFKWLFQKTGNILL